MTQNLLLVMVDQLAARWLPFYGDSFAHAPNLAALAAQGTVFDCAYTASPLCAPSRAAVLTGRLSSRLGVFDNAAELAATAPTVMHHLRAMGYETCLSGKMHFVGPDQLHGFDCRLTTDIYPAGVDWTPDWTRPLHERLPWYHTMESVLTPAPCVASMQCDYDDEVTFRAVRHLHDLARRSTADPFLLVVSFSNPHDPWEVPRRYWDLHDQTRVPLPRVAKIPLPQADPHSRRLREMCGIDEVHLSEQQIRQARHGYYAAISYVDERIGAVLAALRETGLDEMTTVVFTADHGEMLGERGLWYKMALFEPAARVPLIIRRAGGLGDTRVREPVSLLDVAPTLLELAGASREELDELGLDGSSLAGARDAPAPVIGEYSAEGVTAPMAMLRAGVHKLIVCPGDPAQLFDLRADPDELRNLAEHPHGQAIVAELLAALERRVDLVEIERRVLASQADRRLVNRGMSRGPSASWDYEPRVDSSMKYVRTRSDLYDLQRRARLESDGGADLA